jgi:hypothetical protein
MSLSKYKSKIKTTSNIEKIIPDIGSLQKQFNNNLRYTITEYAYNVRFELNKNIKMKEHISRLKYINALFKKLLTEMMNKKNTKVEIKNLLVKFNNIFKEDNIILKKEIIEDSKKLNKCQLSLKKEITSLKEQLEQDKNINFILQNKIQKLRNIILRNQTFVYMLNNDMNFESEIPIQDDLKMFDEILLDTSKIYQEALMKALKDLNKIKSKNSEKIINIENLKKLLNNKKEGINIKAINKKDSNIEEHTENSISSFNEFEMISSFSTIENLENKIEKDGNTIKFNMYNLPQKNFIKSSINAINGKNNDMNNKNIISNLEKNTDNKNIILNELDVPKLNLKQIQFNKDNKKYRFTSSFERRKKSSDNSINSKEGKKSPNIKYEKKKIKYKIKLLKNIIRKNKETIKDFKHFYNIIIDKYDKYIYQPEIESYVLNTLNDFKE